MKIEPMPPRNSEEARANLQRIADDQGETLAGLSRFIGRREGYLHAYVSAGIPQALRKAERQLLARYLGIAERELWAGDPLGYGAPI